MKYNVKRLCFLLDFGWCYIYLDIVCSEQGVGVDFFCLMDKIRSKIQIFIIYLFVINVLRDESVDLLWFKWHWIDLLA